MSVTINTTVFETEVGRLKATVDVHSNILYGLEWTSDDVDSHMWLSQLHEHLREGIRSDCIVAHLDAITWSVYDRGTEFQRTVWGALRRIPKGQTRSYSQVAMMINQSSATRAVASAIAKNPIALVNPCHRVIRSDGSVGKFAWGSDLKRTLLEREGVILKR
jgi:O-6-methylguanine DNA methyltransferase